MIVLFLLTVKDNIKLNFLLFQIVQHDITSAEKAVLALESVVSRKRADRHSLLHSAKINQIQVLLVSGNLADVDAEEEEGEIFNYLVVKCFLL